jgi:tetratricopeptide (TPR) repeat protein
VSASFVTIEVFNFKCNSEILMIIKLRHLAPFCLLSFVFYVASSGKLYAASANQVQNVCNQASQQEIYIKALESFIAKKYQNSIESYKQVLRCSPLFAPAFFGLGRNYQELGLKEQSLDAYSKAISYNKTNSQVFSNRGLVKASLGRLNDSILDFNQSILLQPSNFIALTNRGVAFATSGRLLDAKKDFDQALRINANYGEAYINRGIVQELLGELPSACNDWKKAIALRQFSARPWVASQCEKY